MSAWFRPFYRFQGKEITHISLLIPGYRQYDAYAPKWLAWVVGILICIAVSFTALLVGSQIPGVNWRIDKIIESLDDY